MTTNILLYIVRIPENILMENAEQNEKFTVRLSDNICWTDPIMQFLLQKVQHMGHSIELLVSLDRITDIWKLDNENNGLYDRYLYFISLFYILQTYISLQFIVDTRISLNVELQNRLLLEISKYNPAVEETDTSVLQIDKISLQEYDADIERNIIEQLSTLHNPFLMKAMEDYMPCELYRNDTVDACTHNTRVLKAKQDQIYDLYKKYLYA